jgi:hypothetical protein
MPAIAEPRNVRTLACRWAVGSKPSFLPIKRKDFNHR